VIVEAPGVPRTSAWKWPVALGVAVAGLGLLLLYQLGAPILELVVVACWLGLSVALTRPAQFEPEPFVDPDTAARYLRATRRHVLEMVRAGLMAHMRPLLGRFHVLSHTTPLPSPPRMQCVGASHAPTLDGGYHIPMGDGKQLRQVSVRWP